MKKFFEWFFVDSEFVKWLILSLIILLVIPYIIPGLDKYKVFSFFDKTNGDKTNGECVSGDCENGEGTFVYDNGDKYVGEFKDNLKNGEGTYTFTIEDDILDSTYTQYTGEWKDDKFHGQGTYTKGYREREFLYRKGTFKNGMHIEGTFINYPNKYYGTLKNGLRHGIGEAYNITAESSSYKGEFKDGYPHGEGKLIWYYDRCVWMDRGNKDTLLDGMPNPFPSPPSVIHCNGSNWREVEFIGEFKNSQLIKGVFNLRNNYDYENTEPWSDSSFSYSPNFPLESKEYLGEKYDGDFRLTNKSELQTLGADVKSIHLCGGTDGTFYNPSDNDVVIPHGQGTWTYSDGTIEEGLWENGKFIGE